MIDTTTYHAASDNLRAFFQEAQREAQDLGRALAVANQERKREAAICNAALELLVENHIFPDFGTAEDAAVYRCDEMEKARTVTVQKLRAARAVEA